MSGIELWLEHAVERLLEQPSGDISAVAIQARLAIADAARLIATEAALACGSRAARRGRSARPCAA